MPGTKIDTNAQEVARWLNQKVLKQMHFAQVVALNRTARLAKEGELQVMRSRFDSPTPYTMNSLFIQPAKKGEREPQARVYFKDDSSKGTAAVKFLGPEVYGGSRNHKRSEKALIRAGIMKPTQYLVPGPGARLDKYGNVQRGQIVQILSALRAFGEQGYTANRTMSKRSQRKGQRSRYFVMRGHGPGEGIWHRQTAGQGGKIVPVFLFADGAPRYRVRIPFHKIAENITRARLPEQYAKAFQEAMKSAR